MGTEKRERQKANKARQEQEAARAKAKSRTIKLSLLIGGAIVAVFVIVAVAGRFVLDSDDDPIIDDVPATDVLTSVAEPSADSTVASITTESVTTDGAAVTTEASGG